ncbi:MAG TPA: hypothetical protein VFH56_01210 [Acidimicrobiales bacterium]|nr:hypothetical protein [Acidimicrobiales bacterium]
MGTDTRQDPSSPDAGDLWNAIRSDDDKTARRAGRQLIAAYHYEQLRKLLEHIRQGFNQLDTGEIDAFEMDELIHRYHRCAQKLWSFCGSSGGQWLQAAKNLAYYRSQGEEPDWWEAGAPRRR